MKRWRRPLILIALLLLAGAAVNVAVAWGIAAAADHDQGSARIYRKPPHWLTSSTGDRPGFEVSGPGWRRAMTGTDTFGSGTSDTLVVAVGFPCLSLRAVHSGLTFPSLLEPFPPPPQAPIIQRCIEAPAFLRARRWFEISHGYIPTDPVFRGFAINTVFYAALMGSILALPLSFFPIRRRLRARRGRCSKCGYDRAGLAGVAAACPECGAVESVAAEEHSDDHAF